MQIRNYSFDWNQRTYIMGILNVTPDSFSDGGEYNELQKAVNQALTMVQDGANIIDIGGQSTRPGALEVTLEEELNRVIPVIEAIREKTDIPISVDTTRAEVAKRAIASGVDIINDISGATFDPNMLDTVARLQVPIILMHIRGNPQTMQTMTDYQDLIAEIEEFFLDRIAQCLQKGILQSNIIIDPGIGFAKNYQQNIAILNNIKKLKNLGFPMLIGTSRKSFIGKILNENDPAKRVWGTAATCYHAIAQGADILRVHDVAPMYDITRVADAITRSKQG
ncbi:dihydropteroate synthase [Cyanobacterium stanieri LEGE 03274]|uniref:Dihydropteroate synthase n=1 Tax=Cyanobacterium stanieri LEGE 03274 TaxID=1828756 RepID=A0ABR9V6F8_9CHRO|nr:dihydropteroate synthase [Cyanobacterium stanieri]MBE9222424.1 dihydropteroate synthase [Cyanobacterium stanieri LEGE 03274]